MFILVSRSGPSLRQFGYNTHDMSRLFTGRCFDTPINCHAGMVKGRTKVRLMYIHMYDIPICRLCSGTRHIRSIVDFRSYMLDSDSASGALAYQDNVRAYRCHSLNVAPY